MIYDPSLTSLILFAMEEVSLSNNGYADIGTNEAVAKALAAAGFVVIATKDLFGKPVNRAFSAAAQAALAAEPFGVSTYKPFFPKVEGPDYEGMILSRQEAKGE